MYFVMVPSIHVYYSQLQNFRELLEIINKETISEDDITTFEEKVNIMANLQIFKNLLPFKDKLALETVQ